MAAVRVLGYARGSRFDDDPRVQLLALEQAGCDRVFVDQVSGASTARPALDELLAASAPGDAVVVWPLDRLGRNMRHLLALTADFQARGIGLRSLTEHVDTAGPGMSFFEVMAVLAGFEAGLGRERALAGVQGAKAQGRHGGRPKALSADAQAKATELFLGRWSVTAIAHKLHVSRATVYRHLASMIRPDADPAAGR